MLNLLKNIDENRSKHIDLDIDDKYKNCSLHIALERADINNDWETFKKLYKVNPIFLKNHLDNTSRVLDYNYLSLSKNDQDNLFN
jgi:hypothetical protein